MYLMKADLDSMHGDDNLDVHLKNLHHASSIDRTPLTKPEISIVHERILSSTTCMFHLTLGLVHAILPWEKEALQLQKAPALAPAALVLQVQAQEEQGVVQDLLAVDLQDLMDFSLATITQTTETNSTAC